MSAEPSVSSGRVFLYHAVVAQPLPLPDPCFLDMAMFRRQMLYLREHFDVVPLAELPAAIANMPSRPVAAITFDDGFMDNCTLALPILRELQIPATVFLCTELIDTDSTVWFCRVNRAVAETESNTVTWHNEVIDLSSCSSRLEASLRLQESIKKMSPINVDQEVDRLVAELGSTPGVPVKPASPYRMLTSQAIAEMLDSGLIEFGAHTRTHAILSRLSPDQQQHEIVGSIEAVEAATGRPCRLFAYPNGTPGDYDDETLRILTERGIELAVTATAGTNVEGTPPLEIHRSGFDETLLEHGARNRPSFRADHVRRRVLFAYHSMGLGGVETATLAKVEALERIDVEGWVYFHRSYGEGGAGFATHPRVMLGLDDDETLAALLDQGWDAIFVIDFPELVELIGKHGITPPVIYETHTAHASFQDRSFPQLSNGICASHRRAVRRAQPAP